MWPCVLWPQPSQVKRLQNEPRRIQHWTLVQMMTSPFLCFLSHTFSCQQLVSWEFFCECGDTVLVVCLWWWWGCTCTHCTVDPVHVTYMWRKHLAAHLITGVTSLLVVWKGSIFLWVWFVFTVIQFYRLIYQYYFVFFAHALMQLITSSQDFRMLLLYNCLQ